MDRSWITYPYIILYNYIYIIIYSIYIPSSGWSTGQPGMQPSHVYQACFDQASLLVPLWKRNGFLVVGTVARQGNGMNFGFGVGTSWNIHWKTIRFLKVCWTKYPPHHTSPLLPKLIFALFAWGHWSWALRCAAKGFERFTMVHQCSPCATWSTQVSNGALTIKYDDGSEPDLHQTSSNCNWMPGTLWTGISEDVPRNERPRGHMKTGMAHSKHYTHQVPPAQCGDGTGPNTRNVTKCHECQMESALKRYAGVMVVSWWCTGAKPQLKCDVHWCTSIFRFFSNMIHVNLSWTGHPAHSIYASRHGEFWVSKIEGFCGAMW